MISTPTIVHASTPIFEGKKQFRHTAVLAITVEDHTAFPTHNTAAQDKQIFRTLYGEIHQELYAIRDLFSRDPTAALTKFDMLQLQLHNALN